MASAFAIHTRGIDTDLDLERDVALRLLLFRFTQVGATLARADDAEHRHAASLLAAKQCIDRPVGGAAHEIVQRDLDGGLGAVVGVHACGHCCARAGNVFGFPPLEHRGEIPDRRHHAFYRLPGHGRGGSGLAPADDAVIGFDADEHVVRPRDLDTRHDDRLLHRQAYGDRLDAVDLHRQP